MDDIPNNLLDGKIYFRDGDLSIDNPIQFNNALGDDSGRGLIVVRGNLTINSNITYKDPSVLDVKNLASVGWMVLDDESVTKGKITIAPGVSDLVGAFYAETLISTGTAGANSDIPLNIRGLMLAHEFNFERQYESLTRGAEQILYDGRISVNTPPGFEDISRALPTWRQAVP